MKKEDFAETPKNAIVSLKNDRGTNYRTYLEVYNEVKAAYNELRDEMALKKYNKGYEEIDAEKQKEIRDEIPLVISEAEPTSYGQE